MSDLKERLARLSPERRALLERRLADARRPLSTDRVEYAIVGTACRFPGASSPAEFWQLLLDGRDAISEVPPDRWPVDDLFSPDAAAPGKMATRWGGFIEAVDRFDAEFFGIAPREAERMDPQQRLLLETAWEALEQAGLAPASLAGRNVGVFVGIHSMSSEYYWRQVRDLADVDIYTSTGASHSIAANRLSYFFDFRGPSLAIDTACSASLVAVHLACQSLKRGECEAALVGGVNLMLSAEASVALSNLRVMAADGRCKTFDARADGFVRGEGCGIVVLKRLADAMRDGDPILAVIRGSAVNQDGATNGLTAPSGLSQQDVVKRALEDAAVAPARVTFVETHGTGTALGDPVEVEALAQVLDTSDPSAAPCILGAVKTNIGHLEAAAGIAGLIKVVLCLQHRHIPANLHFHTLNPHISFRRSRLRLPGAGLPWLPESPETRVAAVSSFGFGGTNAHLIVEEFQTPSPLQIAEGDDQPVLPLMLSARNADVLEVLSRRWTEWLRTPTARSVPLHDIAYTMGVRRAHHAVRRTVLGRTAGEWADALEAALGIVYEAGDPIDFNQLLPQAGRVVQTPSYPFQRTRHWLDVEPADQIGRGPAVGDVYALEWRLKSDPGGPPRPSVDDLRTPADIVRRVMASREASLSRDLPVLLGSALAAAVERVAGDRGLRVLEVGGKADSTKSDLLPALPRSQVEYFFAAESTSSLLEAENSFGQLLSFVRCKRLDVRGDMSAQGVSEGQFDIVLASEAGAMLDSERVIENLRRVLAPGGLLVLGARNRSDRSPQLDDFASAQLLRAGFSDVESVSLSPHDGNGRPESTLVMGVRPGGDVMVSPSPLETTRRTWCIFADQTGVAANLVAQLSGQGHRVVVVSAGEAFDAAGDLVRINPARREDLDRLASRLVSSDAPPFQACVHLWALDAVSPDDQDASWADVQTTLCLSATQMASALARAGVAGRAFWLVSRGAQAAGVRSLPISLAGAPLWGAGRVIALECPGIWGGLIDLDPVDAPGADARALLREISHGDDEDQIVLRRADRYVPRLVHDNTVQKATLSLRRDRAYLITGGTGGLGLQVARWMANRGAGWLVLASRRGWPAPGDSEIRDTVDDIRRLGAVVEVVATDVCDSAALHRLIRTFGAERPVLAGVMHGAGVIETRALNDLGPAALNRVMAPKVAGTWNLHRETRNLALDHFVLFSSAASLLGAAGMAHYAAANQFLDAVAHERRRLGLPALCVNWGWWQGGGTSDAQAELFRQSGLEILPSAEALDALGSLMMRNLTQQFVVRADWGRFAAIYGARGTRPLLAEVARDPRFAREGDRPPGAGPLSERLRDLTPDEASALIATHIRQEVADLLRMASPDAVANKTGFFALGMDSITSVELRKRLATLLDVELPLTLVFEYPTVESLSAYLLAEWVPQDRLSQSLTEGPTEQAPLNVSALDDRPEAELAALLDEAISGALGSLGEGSQ